MRNKENIVRLNRERYQRIKDEKWYKDKKKGWYLSKAKKISESNKARRAAHRLLNPIISKTEDEKKSRRKMWMESNRHDLNTNALERRRKNLAKYQQYAKNYYASKLSFKVQWTRLNQQAKERGIGVNMLFDEFTAIVSGECTYCGEAKERRGIDRVDNSKGYTKENSASCCKICNYMKKHHSVDDFLSHIKKIAAHNI